MSAVTQQPQGGQTWIANGSQEPVPKNRAKAHEVKQGSKIKATYEEREGKKVVTSLQIVVGPQTK